MPERPRVQVGGWHQLRRQAAGVGERRRRVGERSLCCVGAALPLLCLVLFSGNVSLQGSVWNQCLCMIRGRHLGGEQQSN